MWNDLSSAITIVEDFGDLECKENIRMSKRPQIPAELKRKVLIEAGHRCAIQTCRHPTTDLHHIVPWEVCQEHCYHNLIALCPNCHRRAELGEIDRKSLRIYKIRIAASFGISEHEPMARQFTNVDISDKLEAKWVAEKITESYKSYPPYELDLEFPQFNAEDEDINQINILQRSRAIGELLEIRGLRLYADTPPEERSRLASSVSVLSESFEISCFTSGVTSIRYSIFRYGAGAMHPNHYTQVANYQRRPLMPLDLHDIFKSDSPFLERLSAYCTSELTKQKKESEPSDCILEGAGPKLENYRNFNLAKDGLLVKFDEYQVGSYAEGDYNVFVPGEVLAAFVQPGCLVQELWRM